MVDRAENRISTSVFVMAVVVAVGLGAFDPLGWDHFGPVRWLAIPALGFWAVAARVDELQWERAPVVKLWGAFLIWGALASATAADRLHAWIGTPDRRFGWLIWLLCGGLFLAARRANGAERHLVVRGFAIGALALGFYTIAETAGLAIDTVFAGNRAGGPFGQPAYLGAAAVLATPIAAGLAADRDSSPGWRAVGGTGAAVGGFALLASQSRAAWLAALVAGVLWLLLAVVGAGGRGAGGRGADQGSRWVLPAAVAAVVSPVLAILVVPSLRDRLTSSVGDGGVVQGRLDEWQVGLRALWRSPIVGYGPEGYRTVFGSNVDEQYVIDWGRQVITDRAHSGILDVALAFGIPGALLYGALLAIVVIAAVRAIRCGDALGVGLGVGAMAYALQQQFLFPLSEVDPLFWIAAGLVMPAAIPVMTKAGLSVARSMVTGLLAGLALVAAIAGGLDLAANTRLASAVDADRADRAGERVGATLKLRPDSIRYLFVASRLARQEGDLDLALSRIDDGLRRSPTDPALRGEQARLQLDTARATVTEPERAAALTEALSTLEDLVEDDPNHPEHLQRLGIARALSGDFDGAVAALERAVTLAPDQPEPRQNLQEVLRMQQADR